MSLKEQKYEKALNAMLIMSTNIVYGPLGDKADIEDTINSDLNLKGYFLTLKKWIEDDNSKLNSFPTELSEQMKELMRDIDSKTRLDDLVENIEKDYDIKCTIFY